MLLSQVGDATVDGILIGQTLTFSPSQPGTEWGGFTSAGIDYQVSPTLSLFGNAELTLREDDRSISGFGGLRWSF